MRIEQFILVVATSLCSLAIGDNPAIRNARKIEGPLTFAPAPQVFAPATVPTLSNSISKTPSRPGGCRPARVITIRPAGMEAIAYVSVAVANTKRHTLRIHDLSDASISTVARSIQGTAQEVGLSASIVDPETVRICGVDNTVTVIGVAIDAKTEN